MTNYFRITAYHPEMDCSIIMDSNGLFDKIWQFSSELVKKGFKILEVGGIDKFLDGNIEKDYEIDDKYILRATAKGKPETIGTNYRGMNYVAIKVGERYYIPDSTKIL